jgi:hypothetical protein
MLCLGAMLMSLPPQCGDVPIPNWSWHDVEGEERLRGTVSGGYHLVGRYDGETFTVTDVGPYDDARRPTEQPYSELTSPCPEPARGWRGLEGLTQEEARTVHAYARSHPEYVSSWVTPLEPDRYEFSPVLVNVVFAENAGRHEEELRNLWAGPLCVVERDVPTAREVSRIRHKVEANLDELGLQMLWSSGPDVEPVVHIAVVADPGGKAQATLDERYGEGLVELYPALREVR